MRAICSYAGSTYSWLYSFLYIPDITQGSTLIKQYDYKNIPKYSCYNTRIHSHSRVRYGVSLVIILVSDVLILLHLSFVSRCNLWQYQWKYDFALPWLWRCQKRYHHPTHVEEMSGGERLLGCGEYDDTGSNSQHSYEGRPGGARRDECPEMSAPLTIFRLESGEEATYRCEFSNYPYQKVNLSVYGKYLFCFDVQGWSKVFGFFFRIQTHP